MSTKCSAKLEVKSWDEAPFDEGSGMGKLTRASVRQTYSGDIAGESVTEWLMAYAEDGSATFVGLERIRGAVAGRNGSVVLQHIGSFNGGTARAAITVVPGSGTDELLSVSGGGDFQADPKGSMDLELNFG
jgi:Protein of unknown function (DUF3224)